MSALKCSNNVNETEMNNICIVATRRLLPVVTERCGTVWSRDPHHRIELQNKLVTSKYKVK